MLGALVPWCSAWWWPCKIETVFPFQWDFGLGWLLLVLVLLLELPHCWHLLLGRWWVFEPRLWLLVPHCEDLALRLLAVASLPLVHTDYEALCGVCHLDCSPCLVGLGSLFSVGCLVGVIEFLLLAKK